jgi:hypothetical protein
MAESCTIGGPLSRMEPRWTATADFFTEAGCGDGSRPNGIAPATDRREKLMIVDFRLLIFEAPKGGANSSSSQSTIQNQQS